MRKFMSFVQAVAELFVIAFLFPGGGNPLKIEIIHWNDVNGQIESFVKGTSGPPTPCPAEDILDCIGGVISLVHHISSEPSSNNATVEVEEVDHTLRLGSGNMIGGESGWIPSIGWANYGRFVRNHFKPDVTALGMNEFGAGLPTTVEYMDALGDTVLSNVCGESYDNETMEHVFCSKITKIKEISLASSQIGVIGFISPMVEQLSLPGLLKFEDVPSSIKEVVAGVNSSTTTFFIAIGDGDLNLAREIIDLNPEVKLVIHSSGFSAGQSGESESYPIPYKDGFIATAGKYGSSLGRLVLDWEESTGNLKVDSDSSKLVITTRPEAWNEDAQNASSALNRDFIPMINLDKSNILGLTRIPLEAGAKCWREECNLGNLVADAMVHCVMTRLPPNKPFPFPLHAVWHGGALFQSESVKSGVKISKLDVHKWLPYHNRAHLVKAKGSELRKVFKESAGGIDPEKANKRDWGQFLQVSKSIQVHYSSAPSLLELRMTHFDRNGTAWIAQIEDKRDYHLVIPTFLYEGRGVYHLAREYWTDVGFENVTSNFAFDDDCVEEYVRLLREVSVGYDGRINITEAPDKSSGAEATITTKAGILVIIIIFQFVAEFLTYPSWI